MKPKFQLPFLILFVLFAVKISRASDIADFIFSSSTREETVENKDQITDEAEDILIENIFGVKKSQTEGINTEDNSEEASQIPASNSEVTRNIPEEYTFDQRVLYRMTANTSEGKITKDFGLLINPEKDYMAMQRGSLEHDRKMPDITNIVDYENNMVLMISEKSKTAQVYSAEKPYDPEGNKDADREFKIEKTGKTKSILGYFCEEYSLISGHSEGSMWLASDLNILNKSFFRDMTILNFNASEIKGLMIVLDLKLKADDGKEAGRIKLNVVSVMQLPMQFDTDSYQTHHITTAYSSE